LRDVRVHERVELGASSLLIDARLETRHAGQPAARPVAEEIRILLARVSGTRRPDDRLHHHRYVELKRGPKLGARKSRWRHADDGERLAVQMHLAADDVGLTGESDLPEVMAD